MFSCVSGLVLLGLRNWMLEPATFDMDVPLTSSEIRKNLIGNKIIGSFSSGSPFEISISPELDFEYQHNGYIQNHILLENGILCTVGPEKRHCFRVHTDGSSVELRLSHGQIGTQGRIVKPWF
jgi:hypothetical protein